MRYGLGRDAALQQLGLTKTAVVHPQKKMFRRALQLLSGGTSFHGTPEPQKVIRAGRVAPGNMSDLSPININEAYFGAGLPAYPYATAGRGIIAVPTERILSDARPPPAGAPPDLTPRVVKGVGMRTGGRGTDGTAVDWAITPHDVPLARRDSVILPPKNSALNRPAMKALREEARSKGLHVIDEDAFHLALKRLYKRSDGAYGFNFSPEEVAAGFPRRR